MDLIQELWSSVYGMMVVTTDLTKIVSLLYFPYLQKMYKMLVTNFDASVATAYGDPLQPTAPTKILGDF